MKELVYQVLYTAQGPIELRVFGEGKGNTLREMVEDIIHTNPDVPDLKRYLRITSDNRATFRGNPLLSHNQVMRKLGLL